MSRLIAWFAGNSIAANLVMLFTFVAGIATLPAIRQEPFPNVSFDAVSVAVAYPGASPDEIEAAICIRIEEAIHGLRGIRRLYSEAVEGMCAVRAEVEAGADTSRVLEEIRTRVDALDTLPKEAERPVIRELVDDDVLLSVFLYGGRDREELRDIGERVRDEIAALPLVSRPELVGLPAYEIAVEASEEALRRHGLAFHDVTRAIRASSLDLAGGSLKTPGGEIVVRAQAQAVRAEEFERLTLLSGADGTRLRLGDVARVTDGFAESDEELRFDGRPAVAVRLMRSERADSLDLSDAMREYVDGLAPRLPVGVQVAVWNDQSSALRARRDLLVENGIQGLLLILIVLTVFLGFRLAFWVATGISVSLLGAVAVMAVTDVSINMMSLFAFILALGLMVDDAIVISENVASHQSRSATPLAGAISGVLEVWVPVTISVGTMVVFMVPALSLPTEVGKMTRSLGLVAIACLVISLVEALLVLPAHLAHRRHAVAAPRAGAYARLVGTVQAQVQRFIEGVYRPALRRSLREPRLVVCTALAVLMLCAGLVAGGWVRFVFFPELDDDLVSADLVLPEGTPREAVQEAVRHLEDAARALDAELAEGASGGRVVRHVMSAIGDAPDRYDEDQGGGDGPHVAHVSLALAPSEERGTGSIELARRWRERVGRIPGARTLEFSSSDLGLGGLVLDLSLSAVDRNALGTAAKALHDALAAVPAVLVVSDSAREGKPELKLKLRPEAEAMGLTLAQLATQVRQGLHGEEVQRLQRGRDDVAVVVRYPGGERRSLDDLARIAIRLPDGRELPFPTVARAELGRGHASIERRDRKATVTLRARLDEEEVTKGDVLDRLDLPRLLRDHPGVTVTLDGMSGDEAEMIRRLLRDWLLALFVCYAMIAIPLRSHRQALLIVAVVPFGFVGAVLAHLVLGMDLSAFSLVGLVALTGVGVNDAVVLIDKMNRERAAGASLLEALETAGVSRFRANLLTSIETTIGLLPLLLERSAQAAWLKPMAATLGVGIVFTAVTTLVVVPAGYALLDASVAAVRRTASRLADEARARFADVRPATANEIDPRTGRCYARPPDAERD